MKWVLILLAILIGLVAVVWLIGAMLPKNHIVTRAARYNQTPEKVWEAITNPEEMPRWRADLKGVKRLPDQNGLPAWVETSGSGELPLVVQYSNPPRNLVTRIADPQLPFGGTWTYEITPTNGGAMLRITEEGEVRPALFRFMSRVIFSQASTLEAYLDNLGNKFGEATQIRP